MNRPIRDEGGLSWTPLALAASRNHLEAVQLLLKARAMIFTTNEDNRQVPHTHPNAQCQKIEPLTTIYLNTTMRAVRTSAAGFPGL